MTSSLFSAAGLATFGLALWAATASLQELKEGEEFSVQVERANAVATTGVWSGEVGPAPLARRSERYLDGELVDASPVRLAALSPGYHFIESRLTRRGGRAERIVDAVLVGPFGERWSEEPGCGVALSVSAATLTSALTPVVERMALPALHRNPHMGPNTRFEHLEFELTPGGMRFEATLAGNNRVEAEGWLRIRRKDARSFEVSLLHLGHVAFGGEARETADMTGAALGAAVAGPVGAVVGLWLMDDYVDKRAREEIKKALKKGLREVSEVALFPSRVELIPGRPRSAVELSFCDEVEVMPSGVTGRLAVRPTAEGRERDWPVAGPVLRDGAQPRDSPTDTGVRLDLSLDLVNALLDAWTVNGLLETLLVESELRARANLALGDWTTLQLQAIELGLPPVLSAVGGSEAGWTIGLAGVELELSGAGTSTWGSILLSARGVVEPVWEREAGRLRLSASVEDVAVTCARERAGKTQLSSCLGPLLELGDVRGRLDEALAPGGEQLPSVDVRELVSSHSQGLLQLEDLEIARPEAGVLRFSGVVATPDAGRR